VLSLREIYRSDNKLDSVYDFFCLRPKFSQNQLRFSHYKSMSYKGVSQIIEINPNTRKPFLHKGCSHFHLIGRAGE